VEEARMNSVSRDEALRQAWEEGQLDYKLRPHQHTLYNFIADNDEHTVKTHLKKLGKCARRFGKTFTVLTHLNELAARFPGIRMRYAAPTEKSLKSYVKPNMRIILGDCPRDLKPKFNPHESLFVWPNESELWLAGTDKEHAEKLRGPGTDIGVVDEAGSMSNLKYVVNDILLPSTMDNDGRLIIISTPPKTPGHDFTQMCNEAEAEGALLVQTVWQNSYLTSRPDKLQEYIDASGGLESSTWKREYECKDVVDETIAVIGEGNNEELMAEICQPHERPKYFNSFTSMDPGFSPSHTGILFGYIDFDKSLMVIEDEIDMLRMRTDIMAERIFSKEHGLGYNPTGKHMRWSDIEPRLLMDLDAMHHLSFAATTKDHLPSMVNHARVLISQKRLRIHPRCKSLIAQIKSCTWNEAKSGFDFSTQFGHYDLISALIYGTRNADWHGNPFPSVPDGVNFYSHIIPAEMLKAKTGNEGLMAHMFKVTKRARVKVRHGRWNVHGS
jgi:hypothetical protein